MKPDDDELVATVDGSVLRVTINRAEKRNALSRRLLAALGEAFTSRKTDETLALAVLTGAGDKSFAAGGDLRDLQAVRGADAAEEMARGAKAALAAIRSFPVPVVAALNGDALGGGAELAVACDMRVSASHVRIGFIQGRLAISSAWGGGVDLMRLLGTARGLRLLARSEMLAAEDARDLGLFDAVAAPDQSLDEALEAFIAPMRGQAPQVMRAFKALAIELRCRDRETLDATETAQFGRTWAHPDHDAAVERLLSRRG